MIAAIGYGINYLQTEGLSAEQFAEATNQVGAGFLDSLPKQADTSPRTQSSDDEIIIPAIRSGNHLYVEVELNDYQIVTLLVDTGATDIVLQSEAAYELGLMESDSIEATYHTANGPTQHFVTKLDTVRIGETVQNNVRASYGQGIQSGFSDGLLGMSFLKHYYVDLDLEREELHLRPREI